MIRRVVLVAGGVVLMSACGKRQVEVRTAPSQQTQASVQVNSKLSQAVNVYVVLGGTETFLRQVPANSNVSLPVQGIATGSKVTLKAVTIDGAQTFQRKDVVLSGTLVFPLP